MLMCARLLAFYYFSAGSSSESDAEPEPHVELADNPQSLLDENQLFRLNEPKRSMRMYSDDIEKKSAADRLNIYDCTTLLEPFVVHRYALGHKKKCLRHFTLLI